MLSSQKHLFSLDPDFAYLNCAYMSPMLQKVEKIGIEAIQRKRQPQHIKPDDFFKESYQLRERFARLINAEKPERIAIIPSVSYGMATIAHNLHFLPKQKIVLAYEQFPSNVYTWQDLAQRQHLDIQTVTPPQNLENRGQIWNEKIVAAISEKTALVALGNVHWADGTLFDLLEIRKKCDQFGAKLVIDGTQSVGALGFDVQKIRPDALVCAGYKFLMSPYSIGLAYMGECFDNGKPIEQNWITRLNSENFAGLVDYQSHYQAYALKYDMGERSNFIAVPMFIAALEQILEWGVDNIQTYCKNLISPLVESLPKKGYWIENENWRAAHLFGIRIPQNLTIEKVQNALQENRISVSVRGSAIRVSPHVYNDAQDIRKLGEVLGALV